MTSIPSNAAGVPDLSFVGLLASATTFVQVIVVVLVLASIGTWTLLFWKISELRGRSRVLTTDRANMSMAQCLADIAATPNGVIDNLVSSARIEIDANRKLIESGQRPDVLPRILVDMQRVRAIEHRRLMSGLTALATIGSNAPFVGLLGTVWGIMHAFIGIAKAQSTSLAVVAPGIAEALLTTAIGLGVAIPASIIYNMLGRRIAEYRARVEDHAGIVLSLAARDIDRMAPPCQPLRSVA